MREEWLDVNQLGKYSKALVFISNKSFFLNEHITKRNFFGEIDPFFVAKNMLESKVDFDDYFIKRLIITEILY
ncbi:hypothetical protein [Lacinutrix jangbogonensis]|uniref:hypothetical protein n=1 Tax=Lacinutrix jangbogonensis TaxID=1469557 RepID=UPI00053DC16B|nr:hypothetical protein [Lacinutrix jangbogonensis]